MKFVLIFYDNNNYHIVDEIIDLLKSDDNVFKFQNDDTSINKLLDKIESIPSPKSPIYQPFLLYIEDIFDIKKVGIIVTGIIQRGYVSLEKEVEIIGNGKTIKTNIRGIELSRKFVKRAISGEVIGLLLNNVSIDDIEKNMVVAELGSIKAYKNFEAYIYLLPKEETGREIKITNHFKTNFYFSSNETYGEIILEDGIELAISGDSVKVNINLINSIPMEKGFRFAVRENGRTIGLGIVSYLF